MLNILFACLFVLFAYAQEQPPVILNIGNSAPALKVNTWLKGQPVKQFEKGKVYVLEFWATWCAPCKAAMPHLSALAEKYRSQTQFIGIDVYEKKQTPLKEIQAFVDSMGQQMDYAVATEDTAATVADWIGATGEKNEGIPITFVVNQEGRLAWIGHPDGLAAPLEKIVNNRWDIGLALAARNREKYLTMLEDSLRWDLNKYVYNYNYPDRPGRPDSLLLMIDTILKKEPGLKYSVLIVNHTFNSLLQTSPVKAYQYGRQLLNNTDPVKTPPYDVLVMDFDWYSHRLNLSPELYHLGAELYQAAINGIVYPEIVSMYWYYHKMATWYWWGHDPAKAVDSEQKAIDWLKKEKGISPRIPATYALRLKQYQEHAPDKWKPDPAGN